MLCFCFWIIIILYDKGFLMLVLMFEYEWNSWKFICWPWYSMSWPWIHISWPWYSMSWIVISIDSFKMFAYYVWWYYLVCEKVNCFWLLKCFSFYVVRKFWSNLWYSFHLNYYWNVNLWKSIDDFYVVLEMTDKVGRQRMGRESVAHNIARRERAAEASIPRRGRS
jgi:hypothetical protein